VPPPSGSSPPPRLWRTYPLGGQEHEVTAVKLVIGVVIIAFAILDLLPESRQPAFDRRYLPLGGALSGFFGGLSGNQGALRSAFLVRAGLDKTAFVGTNVVSAVLVDLARLLVYGLAFYSVQVAAIDAQMGWLVLAATLAAFAGSFLGARLLKKVTLRAVQFVVAVGLIGIGLAMVAGLV
jgi:uncharacterized membrane protein YfcA